MGSDETWVIIPAFNEGERIRDVIRGVKKLSHNILVVDDGSSDNTSDIVKSEKVLLLEHIVNMGKGAALKTGCDYAFKKGAEIMIVLDADGQHKPEDIPRFLSRIKKGDKIVFGYRNDLDKMPFILQFGNWFINQTIHLLFGLEFIDSQSGFRAFTRDAYRKIRWDAIDYSMESEMIANLGKHKMQYSQIPIPTIYHDSYKGTTIKDGIKIVINMLFWRLSK